MRDLTLVRGTTRRMMAVLLVAAPLAPAAAAAPADAPAAPVVVELFTSQGCSSCPPADALLAELARRPDVLPLAFHIDYWDRLGWRDPFSLPEASARQRDYARRLGLKTVYTPQMVVGGRRDVVGSDRAQVEAAIAGAARIPAAASTRVDVADGALRIEVGAGAGEARLWLAIFERRRETRVRAGENAGRTLADVNIVRSLESIGSWSGAPVRLSRPLPPAGSGVALLLQGADGTMLGAASMQLPE
jgi:hypothetical protein